MRSAFEVIFLAFSLLICTHASTSSSRGSITWLKFQSSVVVKLDTPGYPFWLMDKANAPMMHAQAEKFYWETDRPSAILLNLTMSEDSKTLLINHQPILPLADYNAPPVIEAYQVPADITQAQIKGLLEMGLLRRHWEGLTLAWRYLALDYDRLVWSDPRTGPYMNHEPTLRFRVMGIGAHSRNDVLEVEKQKVLHVTLSDRKHGSSDAPDRSYGITNIELMDVEESYRYPPAPTMEPEHAKCTSWSWKCPDSGWYRGEDNAPPYRFIWRSRFDGYGRISSLRHRVYRKMHVFKEIWGTAGPAMLISFAILMGIALTMMAVAVPLKKHYGRRERIARGLAEDDRLLGNDGREMYLDDFEEKEEIPPPLPQRPNVQRSEDMLVDLRTTRES